MVNFSVQDGMGFFIAFFLFPLIFVGPGFVIGWAFNLFEFKKRSKIGQTLLGIIFSFALSPIIFNLLCELISIKFALLILGGFTAITLILIFRWFFDLRGIKNVAKETNTQLRLYGILASIVVFTWVIGTALMLMDIHWGDKLYFDVVAYDLSTRALIVNAMTRTGVPPVNPGYYPGQPVRLTYLYYFWYSLCSLVDHAGGQWVDGRIAMIASSAWCGLGLMATIGLYTQIRTPGAKEKIWKSALLGIGLLAISGLDAIPASTNMISSRLSYGFMWPPGDIEHWNEPITAWIGAIYWAPNHIASLIACLVGLMMYYDLRGQRLSLQILMMILAGLAFASATGLSIWVTATFVLFWGILILADIIRKEFRIASLMILPGVIALIAAAPFLLGLFQGNSTQQPTFPIAFHIRPFGPVNPYLAGSSPLTASIAYLFSLPINYFLELGAFSLAGLLWMEYYRSQSKQNNVIYEAEQILLVVVILIGTFVRSTAIQANDLGWRSWLIGQFILLIWTIDIIKISSKGNPDLLPIKTYNLIRRLRRPLFILISIGLLTTLLDLSLLRTYPMLVDLNIAGFPNNGLSPDTKLGQRTLAARFTYDYIRDNLPENSIVQTNPTRKIDRPGGLYGSRQMAISDLTAYGVSETEFNWRVEEIGAIFTTSQLNWKVIDPLCLRYSINMLIVNDTDPIWAGLESLERERTALYKNSYYAVYGCGNPIKNGY